MRIVPVSSNIDLSKLIKLVKENKGGFTYHLISRHFTFDINNTQAIPTKQVKEFKNFILEKEKSIKLPAHCEGYYYFKNYTHTGYDPSHLVRTFTQLNDNATPENNHPSIEQLFFYSDLPLHPKALSALDELVKEPHNPQAWSNLAQYRSLACLGVQLNSFQNIETFGPLAAFTACLLAPEIQNNWHSLLLNFPQFDHLTAQFIERQLSWPPSVNYVGRFTLTVV